MNDAEHFAIAASVLADGGTARGAASDEIVRRKRAREAAGDPPDLLEVALLVEGVEVPFAATIAEIYRRMEERLDERAARIAYDVAKLKGLERLQEAVDRADREIRERIREVFGVELGDD